MYSSCSWSSASSSSGIMNVESCSAPSSNDELVEQVVDATDVGNDTVDENEFNLIFLAEERRDQLLVFFRSHGNATACMCGRY